MTVRVRQYRHQTSMVRRGSTVRVRQRALQNPRSRGFTFRTTCSSSHVGWVWSRLWSSRVRTKLTGATTGADDWLTSARGLSSCVDEFPKTRRCPASVGTTPCRRSAPVDAGRAGRPAVANRGRGCERVNSHLRHVFRKLGINSRVELAIVTRDYEMA